jgi:hypothetical protein
MVVYRLKVSLMSASGIYRVLEVAATSTFADLHKAIFKAFHREESHLYSFFLTGRDTKSPAAITRSLEITHPLNTEPLLGFGLRKKSAARVKLRDVGLVEKGVLHYLFDFGDEWWHRLRVEAVEASPARRKFIKLVRSVGESPPQYPAAFGWDEEDEE